MSRIKELFGLPSEKKEFDWKEIVKEQSCPFTHKKCIKTRKSTPSVAIGTCTVGYGKKKDDIIIGALA